MWFTKNKKERETTNYMPQRVEIKKKKVLLSNICRKLFWIIIHLSYSTKRFSMGLTNWNERENWFYSWVCLSFLLNPRVWGLDYFLSKLKIHPQNPKSIKIALASLRTKFGSKNSMSRTTSLGGKKLLMSLATNDQQWL